MKSLPSLRVTIAAIALVALSILGCVSYWSALLDGQVRELRNAQRHQTVSVGEQVVLIEHQRAERQRALEGIAVVLLFSLGVAVLLHLAAKKAQFARSEAQYRTLSQRLQSILEGTDVGTWEWNVQTGEVVFNERWAAIVGYTLQELAPASIDTWLNLAHPDDLAVSGALLQGHFAGELPFYQCEARMRHKNGEWVWVQDRGRVATWTPEGQPLLMSGTHQDITERKRTEAKITELLEEQQAILHSELVGIVVLRERRITWINPAFAQMLGYEAAKLLGQPTRQLYQDEDTYTQINDAAYPLIEAGGVFRTQLQLRGKNDAASWFDMSGSRLRTKNADSIWAFVDISAQKRGEAALLASQKATEEANAAKSRFLATMSHEIRTPMNAILGVAQLLQQAEMGQDERLDYARIILDSGQALLTLLNDILDLSKVEAGKLQLDISTFVPERLIRDVHTLFAESAHRKGLRMDADWHGPERRQYQGDPLRLRQMLGNLVSNAIKFTPSGHIRIDAEEIEHDDETALLEFAVTDTGIGVASERQSRLFLPFSQADNATTREYGGSGLGLSIVRQLAQLMGGEVSVNTAAGQGSRFWFRLRLPYLTAPSSVEPVAKTRRDAASYPPLAGRILVVEDNPTNSKLIHASLKMFGLTVSHVEDGRQCVNTIVQGDVPDLVLMDIQMPVMDGLSATAKIRQWEDENTRPPVPIIALTADAFEADRQHCQMVGMSDFLPKPINIHELYRVLSKWLTAEATVPPDSAISTVASDDAPIFDAPNMLYRLDGKQPIACALLQAAIKDMPNYFTKIETAMAAENRQDIQYALHSMKGLIAQVGGVRFSKRLTEIDQQLQNGERLTITGLAEMREEYAMLSDALEAWLSSQHHHENF